VPTGNQYRASDVLGFFYFIVCSSSFPFVGLQPYNNLQIQPEELPLVVLVAGNFLTHTVGSSPWF
jgi:hypothetical protein